MFTNPTKSLQNTLYTLEDKKKKIWWENYIKHNTKFLGIGIPTIRKEIEKWYQNENIKKYTDDKKLKIGLSMFENKYAEEKISGILFFELYLIKKIKWQKILEIFEYIFQKELIYDWNVCDWLCVKALGKIIENNGFECAKEISKWYKSNNLWQSRASVVSFVNIKNKFDYQELIWKSSQRLIKSKERFSKTAVGWIMREFSKKNENIVLSFLDNNRKYLTKEVIKNSLKYNKKMQKEILLNLKI